MNPLLSAHASSRCAQMGVDPAEAIAALDDPELRYPSPRKYGPGRSISVRGRLAVVHTTDGRLVITVLWHRLASRDAA